MYVPKPKEYMTDEDKIMSEIQRLRRQVLLHSYIYYCLNDNLISDEDWSSRALKLETLQNKYPHLSVEVEMYDVFKNFDHSTGSNLDFDNPECEWLHDKALWLIRHTYENR